MYKSARPQCNHKFTTTLTVQCDNELGHKGPCHVPKLPEAYKEGVWAPITETIMHGRRTDELCKCGGATEVIAGKLFCVTCDDMPFNCQCQKPIVA